MNIRRLGFMVTAVLIGVIAWYIIQLKQVIAYRQTENESLRSVLTATQKAQALLEDELARKQEEVKQLNADISEYSYPLKLKRTLSAAQRKIAEMGQELGGLQQKTETLEGENFTLKARLKNQSREMERLLSQMRQAQGELAEYTRRTQELSVDARIKKLNAQIEKKEKQIKALQESADALEKKFSEASSEKAQLQAQMITIEREYAARLKDKDKALKALNENAGTPDKKIKERIDALQGRVFMYKERLQHTSALYESLREQLKEIAQIVTDREEQIATKDIRIKALEEGITALRLKFANMEAAYQQAQENQRLVVDQLAEVTKLNRTLESRLSDVSGILDEKYTILPPIEDSLSSQPMPKGTYQEGTVSSTVGPSSAADVESLRKKVEVILQPSRQ